MLSHWGARDGQKFLLALTAVDLAELRDPAHIIKCHCDRRPRAQIHGDDAGLVLDRDAPVLASCLCQPESITFAVASIRLGLEKNAMCVGTVRPAADSVDLSCRLEANFVLVLALVLPNENRIAGVALR